MNKKTLLTLIFGALILPIMASAQTLAGIAESVAGQVILVATWIVVIMWVVTGILFLTSLGDPGKLKSAKISLLASVGGTILVILASSAIAIVKNSLGI